MSLRMLVNAYTHFTSHHSIFPEECCKVQCFPRGLFMISEIFIIDLGLLLTNMEELLTTLQFKNRKIIFGTIGKRIYSLCILYSLIPGTSSEQNN